MARKSFRIFVALDADYPDNARIISAGEAAELLYVRGLCLIKRLLTDGYIDAVQLPRMGLSNVEERAAKLVETGLWERIADSGDPDRASGYIVSGWLERNDSADEVAAKRQKKAQAGAKGGVKSGQSRRNQAGGS